MNWGPSLSWRCHLGALGLAAALGAVACTQGPPEPAPPDGAAPPDLRPASTALGALLPRRPWLEIAEGRGDLPQRLSVTGLYRSIAERQLAPEVRLFRPQFELWSDGAEKARYIYLPPGAKIDTSNMDRWQFPVGVKLWKEFRRGGKLLETRLLWKDRAADGSPLWHLGTYLWNEQESEAYLHLSGSENTRGTGHAVPQQSQCSFCHRDAAELPLGFSAIQLSGAGAGLRLRDLVSEGRLTRSPPSPDGYLVPGDDTVRAALGYLHGNCGGCHASDLFLSVDVNHALRLEVDKLASPAATPTYQTTLNKLTSSVKGGMNGTMMRVKPGAPQDSALYYRMGLRYRDAESLQMPPLGTDLVDGAARALMERWITALPP